MLRCGAVWGQRARDPAASCGPRDEAASRMSNPAHVVRRECRSRCATMCRRVVSPITIRRMYMSSTVAPDGRAHATETVGRGRYAPVNGLELYYEIHGQGRPT